MARLTHASAAPFFSSSWPCRNRFRPARFLAFPCFFARPVDGTIAVVAPSLSWVANRAILNVRLEYALCTHHAVGRLLLLFIAVPVVELVLLIEIGQRFGTLATVGLIVGTGTVGAALARQQGISTLARLRKDLNDGRLPAEPIVDGVLILVAAVVLITPGVLTDLVGFLCLVPACRRLLKLYLKRRFERAVREGAVGVTVAVDGARDPSRRPPMRDVTPRRPADPDS